MRNAFFTFALCLVLQSSSNAQLGFELAVAKRQDGNVIRLSYPPCTGPECVVGNHDVPINASAIEVTLLDGRPVRISSFLAAIAQPRVVIVTYGRPIPKIYLEALAPHVVVLRLPRVPEERLPVVRESRVLTEEELKSDRLPEAPSDEEARQSKRDSVRKSTRSRSVASRPLIRENL